jgi:hypothetical protein
VGLHAIVQQFILSLAWILAAVLLLGFSSGFYAEMSPWLSAPFLGLVLISLLVSGANIAYFMRGGAIKESTVARQWLRWPLMLAIPLAYLAASLDCTGLSPVGCSAFCTFIKILWIPLLALVCLLWLLKPARAHGTGTSALPAAVLLMSLVPIAPHCICFNPGNGMWIEMIGASPVCYVWGLAVSVISVSAILSGKRILLSTLVCYAIISGALAFFAAHHFLHFPW